MFKQNRELLILSRGKENTIFTTSIIFGSKLETYIHIMMQLPKFLT